MGYGWVLKSLAVFEAEVQMYNPVYMSNNFLVRAHQQKVPITAMKIQKMLYFLYRDYIISTGNALFSERFSTWKYGPVLESVYHTYKNFGANSIKGYGGIPAYSIDEKGDPNLMKIIDSIWLKSLPYNGIELSLLTHRPTSAWYKAWSQKLPFLRDEDIKDDRVEI